MSEIIPNVYNIELCSVRCPWRVHDDQIHGYYCRRFDVVLDRAYRTKKCFGYIPLDEYILPKEMLKL
jgi:signal peptidase I